MYEGITNTLRCVYNHYSYGTETHTWWTGGITHIIDPGKYLEPRKEKKTIHPQKVTVTHLYEWKWQNERMEHLAGLAEVFTPNTFGSRFKLYYEYFWQLILKWYSNALGQASAACGCSAIPQHAESCSPATAEELQVGDHFLQGVGATCNYTAILLPSWGNPIHHTIVLEVFLCVGFIQKKKKLCIKLETYGGTVGPHRHIWVLYNGSVQLNGCMTWHLTGHSPDFLSIQYDHQLYYGTWLWKSLQGTGFKFNQWCN